MAGYVQLPPEEILERIAKTLKREIGPAVGEAYPKTQAFMASVVLEKLAGQLRLADEHATADRRDLRGLFEELDAQSWLENTPLPLQEAVRDLGRDLHSAAVSALIRALYATRPELGEKRFSYMIGCVRARLRARIGREMVYSA